MAKRIAVFASGNGSNFQVIAEQFPVEFVFSDHRDAYALERAKDIGVARHAFELKEFDNKAAYEEAIKRPVRTEVYYVDPVTGEELVERSDGAERKTREVIDPAILDGWENDIV